MVGKPIVPLRCRLPGRHLRGRGLLGLAGVVALGGWLAAGTALAQASETLPMGVPGPDAGATEDVTAGSQTVPGHYRAGDIQADWEAAVRSAEHKSEPQ